MNLLRTRASQSVRTFNNIFPRARTFKSEEKWRNHSRSVGLLSGVGNIETSLYYSIKLDLKAASKLLSDKTYIYESALKDIDNDETKFDEYLSGIEEKINKFFEDETVWNRNMLKGTLKEICEHRKGIFTCLLGGKSTGKSLVLHDMEKNYPGNVFLVDLRKNPSILDGLLKVLYERNEKKYFDLFKAIIKFFDSATDIVGLNDVSTFLKVKDFANKKQLKLPELIDQLLLNVRGVATIVIDEANIAFTLPAATDKKKMDEINEALALFTYLTKQKQKVSGLY